MIKWMVTFFVLAIVSALFGFGLIANLAFGAARILFYVFLALAVVSLIFGRKMFGSREEERTRQY